MIRSAGNADAPAISRVHVASWRTTYAGLLPDRFLASLAEASYVERWQRVLEGQSLVYVVEDHGQVVGFASAGRERAGEGGRNGREGELYAIYLLQGVQGLGHGRRLVAAAVEGLRSIDMESMVVWVLRDNPRARSFYERLGGQYLREQPIEIGGVTVTEVAYRWPRLEDVRLRRGPGG